MSTDISLYMDILSHINTYICTCTQLKLAMEANRQARLQLAEKRGDARTQDRGALAFDIDLSSTEKPNLNGGGYNSDPKPRRHAASSPQLSSVPTIREEYSSGAGSGGSDRKEEKVGNEGDDNTSEATIKRVSERRGAGGGKWGEPTDLSDYHKLPINNKTSTRNTPSDTPQVSSTGRNILHSTPTLPSPTKQQIQPVAAEVAEAKESRGRTESSPDPPPYNTSTPRITAFYTAERKDDTSNLSPKDHDFNLSSSLINPTNITTDEDDASAVLLKLQSNERYQEDIRRRAKETFQKRRLEKKNKGNFNNRENMECGDITSTSSGSGNDVSAGASSNSNIIQLPSSQAITPTASAQPVIKQASPNPSPSEIMTGVKGSKLSSVLESVASAVQIVNNTVEGHRQGPTSSPVPTTTSNTTSYTKTNNTSSTSTTTTHASAEARKPDLNLTLDETLDRWFICSTAADTHPTSTSTIPTVPTPSTRYSQNTLASKATRDDSDRYAKEEAKITLQIQARKGHNTTTTPTTTTPTTTYTSTTSNNSSNCNIKSPPYVNYSKENALETNKDKELSGLQCVLANELMSDDSQ